MRSNNNENKSPVDTTVTYLSLMKPSDIKRAKMAENRKREEENAKMMAAEAAERKRLLKLFTDHAFLFLTCADAIMAEPKIACVEIPTENGMAFTGAMPTPTIGTYVEMWTTSPYAVRFYKKGLSLMWGISGNPMTEAMAVQVSLRMEHGVIKNLSGDSSMWHRYVAQKRANTSA